VLVLVHLVGRLGPIGGIVLFGGHRVPPPYERAAHSSPAALFGSPATSHT
jgi:hypothetical protein